MSDSSVTPDQLRDLALLYLSLAHGADEDLDPEEVRAISVKLRDWQPDRSPAYIDHVIREATLSYLNQRDRDRLRDLVAGLGEALPEAFREQVLRDLVTIAEADGVVAEAERVFIREIADAWGHRPQGR